MRPFKPKNKFGAKRTGGYASKREAEYAELLKVRKASGEIVDWLEQVPIKMPGCKYVCDFMLIYSDGRVEFVEIKGVETAAWKVKLRVLEETRPHIFRRLTVLS